MHQDNKKSILGLLIREHQLQFTKGSNVFRSKGR
jgi:hypothetical protein